jgi:endonuclease YncB( thermonuclease family)
MITALLLSTALTQPLPDCSGGNRSERQVTCLVDGDTGWEAGRKWRYEAIDTPEVSQPECDRERELGYRINWSGESGYYGRDLVTITLPDGRDAGEVLIDEGLAQRWPNEGNRWCE